MAIRILLLHDPARGRPWQGADAPDVVVLDLAAGVPGDLRAIDGFGLGSVVENEPRTLSANTNPSRPHAEDFCADDAALDPSLEGRAESTRSVEPGWGAPGLGVAPPRSAGADSPSPAGRDQGGARRRGFQNEVRWICRPDSPLHRRMGGPGLYVRVWALSSEIIAEQLRWAMDAGADGIVLPQAVGLADIEQLGAKLAVAEAERGIPDGATRILAVVGDTAAGTLALPSLKPTRRLAGLAYDPAALAARLSCDRLASAVTQAGAMLVLAAAACGVPAILVADQRSMATAAHDGFTALLTDADS